MLNLFKLICKVAWTAYQYFSSLLKSNFYLAYSFSIFLLGDNICMLDFQTPSSKERKKKKKFLPFTMLVALLVLSWRLIPIFRHGSMMWWILMECIVPCLWLGQSMYQIFLGPIRYVLEFSILHPYFFLAWRMALDLANLCFRLMWILWKKACGWLEACNHWLALNRPNMCLLMRVGYAMLISECFWLELCLIVELVPDFTDFLGTLNGNCWHY